MKLFRLLSAAFILLIASHLQASDFPYHPKTEIKLISGLGNYHHPVTTKNPEAQKFFDQGLTLIYAFNHDAAYWSFQKAAALDPDLAMAYWGMALALGQNINTGISPDRMNNAYKNIQKALSLSNKASESEKDYINALALRYTNAPNPDLMRLATSYRDAMRKLKQKYPDDPDAGVLFAEAGLDVHPWKQWTNKGDPLPGTLEVVNELERILKMFPGHLGANHYYIHAIEASSSPERALMSAERLRKMLPASGHILHMPSHIFLLVGDYRLAAEANEAAVAADLSYIRQYGIEGTYPLHYLSHNYYFMSRAYSMMGRYQSAKRSADDLVKFYGPHFKEMPELEYYLPTPMFTMIRFQKWQDILNAPKPSDENKITQILWHFGRALAFANTNQIDEALKEQSIYKKEMATIPPETIYGYNKVGPIFQIGDHLIEGAILEKTKKTDQAIDNLKRAVAIQDTLNYNDPPDWFFPVRESLGGLLLRQKQFQEAEKVFRIDLEKHPRNGRALFGLTESLKGQERNSDAFWTQREFERAWMYSDTPLKVSDL